MNVLYRSPTYKSMAKQGDSIVLTFDNVGDRLKAFDVPEIRQFYVAGADKEVLGHERRPSSSRPRPQGRGPGADGVADPALGRPLPPGPVQPGLPQLLP